MSWWILALALGISVAINIDYAVRLAKIRTIVKTLIADHTDTEDLLKDALSALKAEQQRRISR